MKKVETAEFDYQATNLFPPAYYSKAEKDLGRSVRFSADCFPHRAALPLLSLCLPTSADMHCTCFESIGIILHPLIVSTTLIHCSIHLVQPFMYLAQTLSPRATNLHSASPISFSSIAYRPKGLTALVSGTCCSLQVLVSIKDHPCHSQAETFYSTVIEPSFYLLRIRICPILSKDRFSMYSITPISPRICTPHSALRTPHSALPQRHPCTIS